MTPPRCNRAIWGAALGAATLAQGICVIVLGRLEGRAAAECVLVSAAVAVAIGQAWVHRGMLNHRADMVLVMLALGGLGMIVGTWIDAASNPGGLPSCCARSPWSWMTGLMLLGGIGPSLFLTRCARLARSSWRRFVATHVVGNVTMVAGMIWSDRLYGRALGSAFGNPVTGSHVAMLLGMLVAMVAGTWIAEVLLGLAPWREGPVGLDE